ncbi:hypothetical protein C6P40_000127 [Pichia californica]|uniref:Leucine-rich repeat-containing protein n=1 Tax=Pichia californica TaxID=460514 RepID=A0A9P6WL17_9ASCO|nr:hypothetical protein C6P40_000127 [[Candida] californica]
MGGPLLPFAYDQSRQDENLPPLNLSQQRQKKRSADNFNHNNVIEDENYYKNKVNIESESTQNLINNLKNDNKIQPSSEFIYSSLNSSSSIINEINQPYHNNNNNNNNNSINFINTSSTVLNFDDQNFSSDSLQPNFFDDDNNNIDEDVPSSPLLQSQHDLLDKKEFITSDAFDDLISSNNCNNNNNNNNEFELKHSIPSSPTLLPLSEPTSLQSIDNQNFKKEFNQSLTKFQRPKLNKQVHSLSRHGSTFNEPIRKKQRNLFDNEIKKNKLLKSLPTPPPPPPPKLTSKIEFAIDRDGHVYGYKLETDKLPENYRPTLYDEPIYFIVKNSPIQEQKLHLAISQFFEQELNFKNPVSILNLQSFSLNSLPDNITDIQNFYDCTKIGIIKPLIHIDASYNNLRSINPMVLSMERLEMLSLRNNKIARLSGKIDKAKYLKSLNLAMNKFKFLPHNILSLNNLDVLATTGNPMISQNSVDKFYKIDFKLLKLFTENSGSKEFLDIEKQIKSFSRLHWLKSNKQISKSAAHASLLSRSLTTLQDLCYDDNGNFKDWDDFDKNSNNNKLIWRKEKQNLVENELPWCPKLTELALRKTSNYLISQSEVQKWKNSTSEFIYKRAMNSLIYGTNGETCGYCNENCVESVADMLEWWDFKGSKSVTIKRRFCSKHCAICWMEKLNQFKLIVKNQDNNLNNLVSN